MRKGGPPKGYAEVEVSGGSTGAVVVEGGSRPLSPLKSGAFGGPPCRPPKPRTILSPTQTSPPLNYEDLFHL